MQYYYADKNNKTVGPIPEEVLNELFQNGTITTETNIIPEGGTEWTPLSRLKGFSTGADMQPSPPLPIEKQTPAIWNPNVAAGLSLLFSPIFGSIIHALNAKSLGRKKEETINWLYFGVSLILALFIHLGILFLVLFCTLIIWSFFPARKQILYVKQAYGTNYPKKSWKNPLLSVLPIFIILFIYHAQEALQNSNEPRQASDKSEFVRQQDVERQRVPTINAWNAMEQAWSFAKQYDGAEFSEAAIQKLSAIDLNNVDPDLVKYIKYDIEYNQENLNVYKAIQQECANNQSDHTAGQVVGAFIGALLGAASGNQNDTGSQNFDRTMNAGGIGDEIGGAIGNAAEQSDNQKVYAKYQPQFDAISNKYKAYIQNQFNYLRVSFSKKYDNQFN